MDTLSAAVFVLFRTELPWAYEGTHVAWKQTPQVPLKIKKIIWNLQKDLNFGTLQDFLIRN